MLSAAVCSVVFVGLAAPDVQAAHRTSSTAPRDPVVASIKAARKRHAISKADARTWLRDWSVSGRAVTKLTKSKPARAAQIVGARSIATRLARRHKLVGERFAVVMAGVHATTDTMLHGAYPRREQRLQFPGDAATYGFYPGFGVQLQPLFTFSAGNAAYQAGDVETVTAIADRMLEIDTTNRHYRAWEYVFPWQGATDPWVSAMTESVAMAFYARAWKMTGNTRYLATAHAVMPGFLRTAQAGGLMTYEGAGRWYLLYPFNPKQRVLNGHLQALLSLGDYATITGDTQATDLQTDGINAVLPLLSRFDTGAWSRYQLGQEADLGYHDLMVTQLSRLGNRTGVLDFTDLATRFQTYRITPPTVTQDETKPPPVFGVRDGYRDSLTTRWFIDKRSTVLLSIVNADDVTVRTYRDTVSRGKHNLEWDGFTDVGTLAPAGVYHLKVRATDVAGNRATAIGPVDLVAAADTTSPIIRRVRLAPGKGRTARVTVKVTDTQSGYVVIRVVKGGAVVGSRKVSRRGGSLIIPGTSRALAHATIMVTDSSGNRTTARL